MVCIEILYRIRFYMSIQKLYYICVWINNTVIDIIVLSPSSDLQVITGDYTPVSISYEYFTLWYLGVFSYFFKKCITDYTSLEILVTSFFCVYSFVETFLCVLWSLCVTVPSSWPTDCLSSHFVWKSYMSKCRKREKYKYLFSALEHSVFTILLDICIVYHFLYLCYFFFYSISIESWKMIKGREFLKKVNVTNESSRRRE